MVSWWFLLSLTHLIGLALGVGAATVKLMLLLKCKFNFEFVAIYLRVFKPITRIIVLGLILLTLSGIGWLLIGKTFTLLFIVKLALVLVIWILGPIIDNVVEPKYVKLAPVSGENPSQEFIEIQRYLITLEAIATILFYVVTIMGVLV
jgi:hypothetical protein